MRSSLVMLRSTRPPRHSRVCSSTMDTILTGRPSVVVSNWRSTAHTAFGASATARCGRGAEALAPAALRHPQALIAPKPLNPLLVGDFLYSPQGRPRGGPPPAAGPPPAGTRPAPGAPPPPPHRG